MSRPTADRWTSMRLPVEVHKRLAAMASEVQAAHVAGRTVLTGDHADRLPLHAVVVRLLDEVEARRERSRRPRRRKVESSACTDPPGSTVDRQ